MVVIIKYKENPAGEKTDFVNLTREYFQEHKEDFFAIEHNWTELGETPWSEENFLMEVPLKWKLSFAADINGRLAGYVIGSKFDKTTSRVNKILVDISHRKKGIAKRLMELYFEACLREGIRRLELKALVENKAANKLYESLGYKKIGFARGSDGQMRAVYEKILAGLGDE
jgi:ribosomal-protein-alanine N-acetyltransferase